MNRSLGKFVLLLLTFAATVLLGQAALAQARVSAEKQSYAHSEPITVQWSGLPRGQNGWIGIGQVGGRAFNNATEQSHTLSNFHGDVSSGRFTFRGLGPGTYEIRLILPQQTSGDTPVLARATVTVGEGQPGPGAPSLRAEKQVYEQMEQISVSWSNITLVNGWVGIGKRGGTAFSFADREQFQSLQDNWQGRPMSGNFVFHGRLAGEYEIRIVTGELHAPKVLLRMPITVKE